MVSIRPFDTIKIEDNDVATLQRNVEKVLKDLYPYFPNIELFLSGKLVQSGTMTGPLTDNVIYHGLGRIPVGIIKVWTLQMFNFRVSTTNNTKPKTEMILQTDVGFPVGATFWVF